MGSHYDNWEEYAINQVQRLSDEQTDKLIIALADSLRKDERSADEKLQEFIGNAESYTGPVLTATSNMVDHPKHYNSGKIEVICAIEDWKLGFNLGNCVKYIARADLKGKPLEDLLKAKFYLDREIQNRKNNESEKTR